MREPEGVLPNTLALGYAISAYLLGLFLLTRSSPTAVLPGILLTAHSMVIASYLIHECAHRSLFRARSMKRWTGELPFRQLLRTFHRSRLARILGDACGEVGRG